MFDFSNYSTESKYYNDSNKLVIGKMKDKTVLSLLKSLLDWSQRCINSWQKIVVSVKKQRAWIKMLLKKKTVREYEDVLLNKKYLRHSINRISSKNHRIGT